MKTSLKPIHSGRIARWLGEDRAQTLSDNFRTWYGPPIRLIDVPGAVFVLPGGSFAGTFERGFFGSALDSIENSVKKLLSARIPEGQFAGGFTSVSDVLSRGSGGFRQLLNGNILKNGPTGVTAAASSLWRVGAMPGAGAAASAAPGGRILTKATAGAMTFTNPGAGVLRLVGADFSSSVLGNAVLLYDRIFDVAKTMNSTATEAVTGVPTRFQSTVTTSDDYIGGNFLFIEVGGTALAATAHNWTTCLYQDQANAASTLPSVVGNSGAIVDRLDMPLNTWFCPLEGNDSGIRNLTQMQCNALVATGAVNFVLGHPIAVMAFPTVSSMLPFDWVTNRDLAPYIPADAALSLLELPKPSATATTYNGLMYGVSTAT